MWEITGWKTVVDPESLRHSGTLDMYHERPVMLEKRHGFRIPVRWIACLLLLAGVVAFGVFVPFVDVPWYQRGAFFLILAIPEALLLRELPKPDSAFWGTGSVTAGGALYAVAGIVIFAMRNTNASEAKGSISSYWCVWRCTSCCASICSMKIR